MDSEEQMIKNSADIEQHPDNSTKTGLDLKTVKDEFETASVKYKELNKKQEEFIAEIKEFNLELEAAFYARGGAEEKFVNSGESSQTAADYEVAKEKYRVLNEKHDELMKKLDDMNLELKTAFFARGNAEEKLDSLKA
jgi:chaperonin cofactor prefoldin